jgi:hypothetical protein
MGISFFATASRPAPGTIQPPNQWVLALITPGVKLPEREDHSRPSSSEVKNGSSYTSTPQYVFMVCCLVKHRDNLYYIRSSTGGTH